MATYKTNPPTPFTLMDSMRNIGYSFDAALADIVDNSISAGASNIWINASSEPSRLFLTFLDDGEGMNKEELFEAMRYGSKGKGVQRGPRDLGRFGLGLNTASFSQCTRLTVLSKKGGKLSGDVWDLQVVERTQEWTLIELSEDEICNVPNAEQLRISDHGTLVVWENFDVLERVFNGNVFKGLCESVFNAKNYLGLIYHRFLLDSSNPLHLFINDNEIRAIDPFLERNSKTEIHKPLDITIPDGKGVDQHITVTPYLLPYLKDLSDEDKEKLGGVSAISAMQGFYVYRNKRLIFYGTWFHMSYRNELAKYARIKVDIPTSLDEVWKIDIKKQSAELPPSIKKQLQSCVDDLRFSSKKKNNHRLTLTANDKNSLWLKNTTRDNNFVYRINRNSPLVKQTIQKATDEDAREINRLLDFIENSIPYHDIYTDEANGLIDKTMTEGEKDVLLRNAVSVYSQMKLLSGLPRKQLIERFMEIDPFRSYPWLKEALQKELHEDE